jgi:eukaryotic-like serine/threonine-protein kinase
MAGIELQCTTCGTQLSVSTEKSGKHTNCIKCGKRLDVPLPGVSEGLEFGDFVLQRRIGKGGMGEVWLADQKALSRLAAVKILPPSMAQDDDYRERFLREAKIAGQLHHPNIVAAFSAGMINDLYFLASRYIDGVNLVDSLTINKTLPEKEVLSIALQIADALSYAWDKFKIIHRDIKPENIMLHEAGKPMLLDLGIAKQLGNDGPGLTQVGIIIGTPDYISPEQARGDSGIDTRTDIYSLGATLYHLLTGEQPFGTGVAQVVLGRVLAAPLIPPIEVNSSISPYASALVVKMMSREPADRQQLWSEVIEDIEKALKGQLPKGVWKTPVASGSGISDDIQLGEIDISIVRKASVGVVEKRSEAIYDDVDVDALEKTVEMVIDEEEIDDPVILRLKEPGSISAGAQMAGGGPIAPPEVFTSSLFSFTANKKLMLIIGSAILFVLIGIAALILAMR